MKTINYKLSLVTILLLTISLTPGCKDDTQPPIITLQGGEVLIANEGNFGWGQGTLSIYNDATKEVQNDIYSSTNSESVGNVFQSIASFNGLYFFVINNSGKVIYTDTNFVKQGEITGLTSPRNIYRIGEDKAYVTDLYADAVAIVDMKSLSVIGSIPCNGHSEEGVILRDKFWFTAPETSNIYAIDIATNTMADSITVGWMPESIVLDKNDVLWILNRGDESKSKPPGLASVIETDDVRVVTKNELTGAPTNLVYDNVLNKLFFINEDIMSQGTNTELSRPSVWQTAGNKVFYSIKVNTAKGELYASDIRDFVSKSVVYRYASDGTPLDEFSAGIIAGDFFFP
ncbi:hypothetical protein OAD66_04210 [Bacteroidia bacterium]|nr:hypothetical protein [Bacteroidia bacterium]MDB9882320.1 hypothetical protein [Bacteroidia bacterium]